MVRIRRFNESFLLDGDFLIKRCDGDDTEEFWPIGEEEEITQFDVDKLKDIFPIYQSFLLSRNKKYVEVTFEGQNRFLQPHCFIFSISKLKDEWWIIIDTNLFINTKIPIDIRSADKDNFLCDGEDGLKLFNELLQGKNLESKDIIW